MYEKSFHFDFLLNNVVSFLEKIFFSKFFLFPLLFLIGIISGLKLSIAIFLCFFTLLLCLFCILVDRKSESLAFIIISLYLVVNYEILNTPSILRYLVYILAVTMFAVNNQFIFKKNNFLLFSFLIICVFFATFVSSFFHYIQLNIQSLFRDFFVIFLLFFFCLIPKEINIKLSLIFVLLFGVLIGEIIYIATNEYSVYFNYSSVKTLILFLPYYLFLKGKNGLGTLFLVLCLIPISNYGTRMIILSSIVLSVLAVIIFLVKRGSFRSIFLASIFFFLCIFSIQYLLTLPFFLGFKTIAFLGEFYNPENTSIYEIFKILDPVRYAEHQIFFSRSLFEILFGNGLGAGIVDTNGYLGFVNYFQSAFSQEEINSNVYFTLHDYWIDYGLRFGFVATLFLLHVIAIKPMLSGDYFTGIFYGVMLICMTYSGSGLLILSLFLKFNQNAKKQSLNLK